MAGQVDTSITTTGAVRRIEMNSFKSKSITSTLPRPADKPFAKPPSALFESLPGDLLTRMFANARILNLAAKTELFAADSPGNECYRVEEGSLKVSVISKAGVERTLAIVGADSVIGELSMLDGQPRSATVTALTDCRLKYISRAEFQRFAAQEPSVYEHLTRLLVGIVRQTDSSIAAGAFLPIDGRLAWAFLQLAEEFGTANRDEHVAIGISLSQADIGNLAGISREQTSRILNKWIRQGIVSRTGSRYTILAIDLMRKIAQI